MRARLVLVVAALLSAGCSWAGGDGTSSTVTLDEYHIDVSASSLAPGAELTVRNDGQFGHTLVVTDESGRVVTATNLIPAGETIELEAHWEPGNYRFTCRIVLAVDDGEIVDHYARGMLADVSIRP